VGEGPYTTITVASFNHLEATIRHLRKQIQSAREFLEKGLVVDALMILKSDDDTERGTQ
jgi:hypothetical protein